MLNTMAIKPSWSKAAPLLGIWLVAALVVSALGVTYGLPRPLLPILVWAPVLVFFLGFLLSRPLRHWTMSLDLRWLIGFHIVRLPIGVAFLFLEAAGRLPAEFAIKGGIGDIIIGAAAVVALLMVPLTSTFRVRAVLLWNTLGLADILMVFATAQKIIFFSGTPNAMVELTRFPLFAVPGFVVPVVLITHLVVFAVLWQRRSS